MLKYELCRYIVKVYATEIASTTCQQNILSLNGLNLPVASQSSIKMLSN